MKLKFYSNYNRKQLPMLSVVIHLFNQIKGKKVSKCITRSKRRVIKTDCSVFVHPKFVNQFVDFQNKILKWDLLTSFQFKEEFLNVVKEMK